MARTITFGKLISSLREIPRFREVDFAADMCSNLINRVWRYQDFRETLAPLPPFYLSPGVQDYGKPIYAVPSDFQSLKKAWLVKLNDGGTSITFRTKHLEPKTKQQPIVAWGEPDVISFEPSIQGFRVHPFLATGAATNEYMIGGVYKTLPQSNLVDSTNTIGEVIMSSEITPSNFSNVLLPLDDRYYDEMRFVMKTIAKSFSALNPQEEMLLDEMIENKLRAIAVTEGSDIGTQSVSPLEPLMSFQPTGYGLY